MKTTRLVLIALSAIILAACGGGKKANTAVVETVEEETAPVILITSEGVGPVTFTATAEEMNLGEGYTVAETQEEDMGDIFRTFTVKDKDGKTAIVRTDYMINIYAPEFQTEDGLHAGMKVGEAIKLLGEDIKIQTYRDLEGCDLMANEKIGLRLPVTAIEGGKQRFDVKVAMLDPEAEVESVIVIK